MPYAVTHVIITIVVVSLLWRYFIKQKGKLYYVLVAGVFGLIPDLDYFIYYVFHPLTELAMSTVHRIYSHSFVWVFAILFISLFFHKKMFFYMAAFGFSLHLILDGLLVGHIYPLSPFITYNFNLGLLSSSYGINVLMGLDAIILIGWLYHEYKAREIKDWI